MPPHRIHLKGPWEIGWREAEPGSATGRSSSFQPFDPLGGSRPGGEHRVHLPATWQSLFGDVPGTARFRRRFHCPTNLDADERVWIAFDGIGGRAGISLNGKSLGTVAAAAFSAGFDITQLLQPANELLVELAFNPADCPGQPGGLWAPVALEIHGPPS